MKLCRRPGRMCCSGKEGYRDPEAGGRQGQRGEAAEAMGFPTVPALSRPHTSFLCFRPR